MAMNYVWKLTTMSQGVLSPVGRYWKGNVELLTSVENGYQASGYFFSLYTMKNAHTK